MKLKKALAATTAVALGIGLALLPAIGACAAPAPKTTAKSTCEVLTVEATKYTTKPAVTQQVKVIDVQGTPAVPAVYGPGPLITPAVLAQPAVYKTELEYKRTHKSNGKVEFKWATTPPTHSDNAWGPYVATGATRPSTTEVLVPAVDAKPAVYGPDVLITPAISAVAEVSHMETEVVTPADSEPNTITVTINGTQVENKKFGESYGPKDFTFADETKVNNYVVTVTAWDGNGSETISGSSTPCAEDKEHNSNHPSYWEGPGEQCYKHDADKWDNAHGKLNEPGTGVILKPYGADWWGDFYSKLIVKAGSADTGSGPGNVVYNMPTAGPTYYAPDNKKGDPREVSHWIICKGETPPTVITEVPNASGTDECGTENDEFTVSSGTTYTSAVIDGRNGQGVGTVTVTFTAKAGYVFPQDTQTVFELDFTNKKCDTEDKVEICHANEGVKGFVHEEVSHDSILKNNGHGSHEGDIIPPFHYVYQGQEGDYPGLNWDPATSPAFVGAGCVDVPTASATDVCGTTNDKVTYSTSEKYTTTVVDNRVNGVGTVTVDYEAKNPHKFPKNAVTHFEFAFTNVPCADLPTLPLPDDQLPTLALTGSNPVAPLMAAMLMLLFGATAGYAVRRRTA